MTADTPSGLLRVQGTSRLAFGATTAALVTLASGGTALLVSQATSGVTTPTALPPGGLPHTGPGEALVVGRVAGTPAATAPDRSTERALRKALAARREPGRRTLTAPLVPLPAATPAVPPPPAPVVVPPVPVQQDPQGHGDDGGDREGPRPHRPGDGPAVAPGTPGKRTPHAVRPHAHVAKPAAHHAAHADRGKHEGKHARPKAHGKGRHAR